MEPQVVGGGVDPRVPVSRPGVLLDLVRAEVEFQAAKLRVIHAARDMLTLLQCPTRKRHVAQWMDRVRCVARLGRVTAAWAYRCRCCCPCNSCCVGDQGCRWMTRTLSRATGPTRRLCMRQHGYCVTLWSSRKPTTNCSRRAALRLVSTLTCVAGRRRMLLTVSRCASVVVRSQFEALQHCDQLSEAPAALDACIAWFIEQDAPSTPLEDSCLRLCVAALPSVPPFLLLPVSVGPDALPSLLPAM